MTAPTITRPTGAELVAAIDQAAADLATAEAAYADAQEMPGIHPYAVAELGHRAACAYAEYRAAVETWTPGRADVIADALLAAS
jgi:hypothetical protein